LDLLKNQAKPYSGPHGLKKPVPRPRNPQLSLQTLNNLGDKPEPALYETRKCLIHKDYPTHAEKQGRAAYPARPAENSPFQGLQPRLSQQTLNNLVDKAEQALYGKPKCLIYKDFP
jgi:hypothetical protein